MNSNNHNDRNKSNPRFGQKSGGKDASDRSDKNKVVAPANQHKQEVLKTTKLVENPEN